MLRQQAQGLAIAVLVQPVHSARRLQQARKSAMMPGGFQRVPHPAERQLLGDLQPRMMAITQQRIMAQTPKDDPDGGVAMAPRPVDEVVKRHDVVSAASAAADAACS